MTAIKTELTAVYSTILDFQVKGRQVASRLNTVASRYHMNQVNRPEEFISTIFDDDNAAIECNWTFCRFRSEGARTDYDKTNGPLRFYFQTLQEIANLDSFGEYKSLRLELWDVIEKTGYSPEQFNDSFLPKSIVSLFPAVIDSSIKMVFDTPDGRIDIDFGPYLAHEDPKKHNLVVFERSSSPVDLGSLEGLLTRSVIFNEEHNRTPTLKEYVRLESRLTESIKKLETIL